MSGFFSNVYVKNLLLAFAIVLVLIFIVLGWLNVYTKHGKEINVPDVKGLQVAEAVSFFRKATLNHLIIDSVYVKNKPAGSIIETVPPVGTRVKEGRTIYLTVNSGTAQMLIIPSVKDMSQRQATAMLTALGFEAVQVQLVSGAYRDLVVGLESRGHSLLSGERVPADIPLTLLVSSGMGEIIPDSSTVVQEIDTEEEQWY